MRRERAADLIAPERWANERVYLVGGGPSAVTVDWSRCAPGIKVVVNDALYLLPNAEVCFTADSHWYNARREVLHHYEGVLVGAWVVGFCLDEDPLSSGLEALRWLVERMGATEIVLVGFDLRGPEYAQRVKDFEKAAAALPRGTTVRNSNAYSALTCFPTEVLPSLLQQSGGMWLPKSDSHIARWLKRSPRFLDKGTYQYNKLKAVVARVRDHNLAVDVGAHIGTWSRVLAYSFKQVVAFEPLPMHVECFYRNLPDFQNVTLHEVALGKAVGRVGLKTKDSNTGETWVRAAFPHERGVPLTTLDTFQLSGVDLLKIDCEGYEVLIVEGAEMTIRENWPAIIVEQDERYAERYGVEKNAAVKLLVSWGYNIQERITCDFILTHRKGRS